MKHRGRTGGARPAAVLRAAAGFPAEAQRGWLDAEFTICRRPPGRVLDL